MSGVKTRVFGVDRRDEKAYDVSNPCFCNIIHYIVSSYRLWVKYKRSISALISIRSFVMANCTIEAFR